MSTHTGIKTLTRDFSMKSSLLISINNILSAIKDRYFWMWFLPFMIFIIFGIFILFAIFDYDKSYQLSHILSSCRKLSDGEALAMLITLFLSISGTLLMIGELFIFIENKKKNYKSTYFSFIAATCVAILATIQALLLANAWCQ